jgi:hypothetical protein
LQLKFPMGMRNWATLAPDIARLAGIQNDFGGRNLFNWRALQARTAIPGWDKRSDNPWCQLRQPGLSPMSMIAGGI